MGGMARYHGNGIPPYLGGIGGKVDWSFLLSSPSSAFDEELEEPLCGFSPVPLRKNAFWIAYLASPTRNG
jgi:hypothetical protein